MDVDTFNDEQKWQLRRFRHLRHYGIKPELVEEKLAGYLDDLSLHTALAPTPSSSSGSPLSQFTDSGFFGTPQSCKKESAIKIVYKGLSNLIQRTALRNNHNERSKTSSSRTSVQSPRNLTRSFPVPVRARLNFDESDRTSRYVFYTPPQTSSQSHVSHCETDSPTSSQEKMPLENELYLDLKPTCELSKTGDHSIRAIFTPNRHCSTSV